MKWPRSDTERRRHKVRTLKLAVLGEDRYSPVPVVIHISVSFGIETEKQTPLEVAGAVTSPADREQMGPGAGVEHPDLLGLPLRDPQRTVGVQLSVGDSTE